MSDRLWCLSFGGAAVAALMLASLTPLVLDALPKHRIAGSIPRPAAADTTLAYRR